MNDNDKTGNQEQEQPITQWPGYAHLVLAFSILFSLVLLSGGVYVFHEMTGSTDGFNGNLWAWIKSREGLIAAVLLILAFFSGAFAFLALKVKTEQGEAAGKAAVLVCRILFYPVHVVIRIFIRFCVVLLLLIMLCAAGGVLFFSYSWLESNLEEIARSFNAALGVGPLSGVLVGILPKHVISIFGKAKKNLEKIVEGVSDLSLFPEMVVKKSWPHTKETMGKIEKESWGFIINIIFLILISLLAVISFSAFNATVPKEPPPPAVQEKTSYIFLRNMPWIVGNVQSFFSSAVVFPRDAMPQDFSDESREGALRLSDADRHFYAAIYDPLLTDLARCGTSHKPVKIELTGFASSSGFSKDQKLSEIISEHCFEPDNETTLSPDNKGVDNPPDDNEIFNVCVANERAKFVEGMLAGFVQEQNKGVFEFTAKKWTSLAEMKGPDRQNLL